MTVPVIIPAAGLGTRLGARTRDTPKELLEFGGRPAIHYALEALAPAGVTQVVVVVAARTPVVRDWVRAHAPAGVELAFVVQPEPIGSADAIERGRALLGVDRYLALFPDYLNPPDNRALAALITAAAAAPEATWTGLVEVTPERAGRLGPTTRVRTTPIDGVHRIDAVAPARPVRVGALQTVYAELRGPAHQALLTDSAFADGDIWGVLGALAAADRYYGLVLPGEVLDVGIPAGYDQATRWPWPT